MTAGPWRPNPSGRARERSRRCYLLGDRHTQDVNDLYEDDVWDRYGVGKDPRCANCLMHCGFESASIYSTLKHPTEAIKMLREGAFQKSGIGAS